MFVVKFGHTPHVDEIMYSLGQAASLPESSNHSNVKFPLLTSARCVSLGRTESAANYVNMHSKHG